MSQDDLLEQYLSQLKQLDPKERVAVIMQLAAMGGRDMVMDLLHLLKEDRLQIQEEAMQLARELAQSPAVKTMQQWQMTALKEAMPDLDASLHIDETHLKSLAILQMTDTDDSENVLPVLLERLNQETQQEVRKTVLFALSTLDDMSMIPALYRLLREDSDPVIRERAAKVLHRFCTLNNLASLEARWSVAEDEAAQQAYIYALGRTQSIHALPYLLRMLAAVSTPSLIRCVVDALLVIGKPAIPRLILAVDTGHTREQAAAAWVLGQIDSDGRSVSHLLPLLDDASELDFLYGKTRLCDIVVEALRQMNTPAANHAIWLWENSSD